MKALIAALASVALISGLAPLRAQAAVEEPVYQCGLEFNAEGTDIQILVGYSKLKGQGTISCVDVHGNTEQLPVKVTIKSPPLFPRISIAPHMKVKGLATGIGLAEGGPEALLGKYLAIEAKIAAGAGLGAVVALHGQSNAITFNLGLQGIEGFGIAAGATMVKIEPLD